MEEWKDIEGFEGLYQVSSEGNVRSVDREVVYNNGSVHIHKGKVLKPWMNRWGYLRVNLYKERKYKHLSVHRLVYAAFCGEIPDGYDVNHLNEVKTDNRLKNLNLMTSKQNANFGTRNERIGKSLSKPVIALDDSGNVIFKFSSTAEAGRNGFGQGDISKCCRGKLKTHRGYRWKYIENA